MTTVFLQNVSQKPIKRSRIWSKPLTSLVSAVLATALLAILILWLQDKIRYRAMIKAQGTMLSDLRTQNANLMNRLLSKDPMTYQILESTNLTHSTESEIIPVGIGTDYAEYELWKAAHPNVDEQLIQDDLAELGISLDSDQS